MAKGKTAGVILIALAALVAIYIYAKFDPETTPFPKCPFFWATGLKCPGCGCWLRVPRGKGKIHINCRCGYTLYRKT